MKLRNKLLLAISGLVFLAVGIAVLIGILTTREQVGRYAARSSEKIAAALDNELRQVQANLNSHARLLADRPGTSTVYEADAPTISDHLEEQTHLINVDWIAISDQNGNILGQSVKSPLKTGQKVDQCNLFSDAIQSGEQSGIFGQGHGISITSFRAMKSGEYVRATIILGKFVDQKMLQRIAPDENTQVEIKAGSDLQVSTMGGGKLSENSYISETRPLNFQGLNGPERGALSVYVLRSALAEPFYPVLSALVIAFLVTTVGASFAAVALSANLSKPLEALSRFAEELEKGVWPDPIHTTRKDEIGNLERTFDSMAATLRANQERLLAMLEIDPLTELLNYRAFRKRLQSQLKTGNTNLQFAMIDLDQIEKFNQAHGEDRGDELIRNLAQSLREKFSDAIAIGRIGGDEFALLWQGVRLEEGLAELLNSCKQFAGFTFSAGIVNIDPEESRADIVIMGAEVAVSQVKNSGRNGIRVFAESAVLSVDQDLSHLQKASYGAVLALAEAVDAKDEYTRGHSTRVANYARDLALAAGYEEGFVNLVFVAGTLHDVGKIGVPDSVLKKTDRLTDEEFELIKLHPVLGEKIVSRIPELAEALPGVRSHHERWDGAGYPDALAHASIPLVARILAIADTYDAMTSDRPYRKGMPMEKALSIISSEIGTQFDPALAPIFVDMMRSIGDQRAA